MARWTEEALEDPGLAPARTLIDQYREQGIEVAAGAPEGFFPWVFFQAGRGAESAKEALDRVTLNPGATGFPLVMTRSLLPAILGGPGLGATDFEVPPGGRQEVGKLGNIFRYLSVGKMPWVLPVPAFEIQSHSVAVAVEPGLRGMGEVTIQKPVQILLLPDLSPPVLQEAARQGMIDPDTGDYSHIHDRRVELEVNRVIHDAVTNPQAAWNREAERIEEQARQQAAQATRRQDRQITALEEKIGTLRDQITAGRRLIQTGQESILIQAIRLVAWNDDAEERSRPIQARAREKLLARQQKQLVELVEKRQELEKLISSRDQKRQAVLSSHQETTDQMRLIGQQAEAVRRRVAQTGDLSPEDQAIMEQNIFGLLNVAVPRNTFTLPAQVAVAEVQFPDHVFRIREAQVQAEAIRQVALGEADAAAIKIERFAAALVNVLADERTTQAAELIVRLIRNGVKGASASAYGAVINSE